VSAPERQCVGCGRRGPQSGFLRLAVDRENDPAQVVVADERTRSGRSAYLCRQVSCLDRAVQRKAFQRAFRASVVLSEGEIVAALKAARDQEQREC
jgi:predicted RNA-binding protein YlxR (DUF448 family)